MTFDVVQNFGPCLKNKNQRKSVISEKKRQAWPGHLKGSQRYTDPVLSFYYTPAFNHLRCQSTAKILNV